MTWRGSTTVQERILAALPYAFPMIEAAPFGIILIAQFPVLGLVLLPLTPFMVVYGFLNAILRGYAGLAVFFALYLLVVRNENIKHFIRFNTMQALLIGIAASIVSIMLNLLNVLPPLLLLALSGAIFLGVMASSIFSIVYSLIGRYGEIPAISEAAHAQVRY
jgi:uncharacterized membrane protein